jgi:hypothetical protein
MKTTLEKVKDILEKPNLGHPSRDLDHQISNLKQCVLILAQEVSYYNKQLLKQ